ncbi:MAG: winged helix-turn-helix transcriptional regulator [Candidatus Hodarchaeota archaeon]
MIISTYEAVFEDPRITRLRLIIIILLIPAITFISIFLVFTIKEYRSLFLRRVFIQKGRSYLTLAEIFKNENRIGILKEILNNPGIHQNELLRRCNLQKGQLQWHLDVLLNYRIIKKRKFGQYSIYYPIMTNIETFEGFENGLAKSETTTQIFQIIQENPGIYSSEISRRIKLARNTVKYHIDKLLRENLIQLEKKGRKIRLYPSN